MPRNTRHRRLKSFRLMVLQCKRVSSSTGVALSEKSLNPRYESRIRISGAKVGSESPIRNRFAESVLESRVGVARDFHILIGVPLKDRKHGGLPPCSRHLALPVYRALAMIRGGETATRQDLAFARWTHHSRYTLSVSHRLEAHPRRFLLTAAGEACPRAVLFKAPPEPAALTNQLLIVAR
jgi:hypothetical protein